MTPTPTPTPQAAANNQLVRDFITAWEQRDSDFIIDCFTDDAVYHSMPLSPIVGKAAIAAWVRGFEDTPPGRLEVHHQVSSDDVVMNERTDRIVLNGQPVTLAITGVFEFDGSRIRAWREYFDLTPAKEAFSSPPS
ncbi:MAG TPA: nuclear transport factor 2 family protein [Acidimicrobiales bacterium]|nr:nuclear transport factor 2 family protein [Acidimicrobiales bacterium]